jgi:hypothetical protein
MIDRFEKSLGVGVIPAEFQAIYEEAQAEFERAGVFFLKEDYLREVQAKCNAFPRTLERVLAEAAALRARPEEALYALFLCRAMEHRELFLKHLACFDFPQSSPFLAFLCLVPSIVGTWKDLVARGVPDDVIFATVNQYEECLFVYKERFDDLGMNKRYFDHLQEYVDCSLLNVGRLRYGILRLRGVYLLQNKKDGKRVLFLADAPMNAVGLRRGTPPFDDEGGFDAFFREEGAFFVGTPVGENGRCKNEILRLPKEEYEILLQPGDMMLDTHIPGHAPLTEQLCAESYARARKLFAAHYPEFDFKGFHCHSWMMSPELAEVMKPGANVLNFQRPYLRYPVPTKGEAVLNFVFFLRYTTFADLPEDTSLQRALKARYLNGERLYEYGGVIPFEKE